MKRLLTGEIGYDINEYSFTRAPTEKEFILNSMGGDLLKGLALYDILKNQNIEIHVAGVCASAATLVLLAAEKKYATPNSQFLIHLPLIQPEFGNKDDLMKNIADLEKAEVFLLNIYESKLKLNRQEIEILLKENRILTASEALEIGLIDEIKELPNTQINNKLKLPMKKNQKNIFTQIVALLSAAFSIKNVIFQDVNGLELDFDAEVESLEQIEIGVAAQVAGAPAEGEYTMPDGRIFIFVAGVLTEIKAATEPTEPAAEEIEALKAENQELKISNSGLKSEITALKNSLNVKNSEISRLQNSFKQLQNRFTNEPTNVKLPAEPQAKHEVLTWNKNKYKKH